MATLRATRLPFFVLLVAACAQRGCQPLDPLLAQFADTFGSVVPVQPADPTPPTVTLLIPDLGAGQIALTPTSPPVTISLKPGQSFFIIASAEDPEGVKEVGFRGTFAIECSYEGETSTASTGLQGPADVDVSPNGQAFTKRWVPRYIDERLLRCSSGETLKRASLSVSAYGRNFAGFETQTAGASFRVP